MLAWSEAAEEGSTLRGVSPTVGSLADGMETYCWQGELISA